MEFVNLNLTPLWRALEIKEYWNFSLLSSLSLSLASFLWISYNFRIYIWLPFAPSPPPHRSWYFPFFTNSLSPLFSLFIFSGLTHAPGIRRYASTRLPRSFGEWSEASSRTPAHCWIGKFYAQRQADTAAARSRTSARWNWNANMRSIVARFGVESRHGARGHRTESRKYHITMLSSRQHWR